ncbi:MAG: site-specific integrase [Rikenellaceae bacterium]
MSKELKVSFYLRHKEVRKDGTIPIMGRITIGKSMAQFRAKCYVAENLWDTKAARALGKSKVATTLNQNLDKINLAIHSHYKELLQRKGEATAAEVKTLFQGVASGQDTLLKYCDLYYERLEARVGIDLSERGRYGYKNMTDNLKAFIKVKYNLNDMPLSLLEYAFIEEFDYYLRVKKKLRPNSASSIVSYFKTIMANAVKDDLLKVNLFASYVPAGEKPTPRSLTKEELDKIMTSPLDIPSRYLVRDLFVFSCFTGISFKDVCSLTTKNLSRADDGVWWINAKRCKTDVEFHVPLMDLPLRIIEKYRGTADGDRLFRTFSLEMTNKHLKQIAKLCGVERRVTYHMSRHSYASLLTLSQGVPMETVSKMLGHSSIKTTQIYAKICNDKIDDDMRKLAKRIEGKYYLADL